MLPTKKPLEVLFVLPPYLPTPPDGYGGIEATAAALLPRLIQAGARITVTTPQGSNIRAYRVHKLTEPLFPRLSHAYNDIAPDIELYATRVMQIARTYHFDVIHDFAGVASITSTLAGALASNDFPPVISTIHGPIGSHLALYEAWARYPNLTFTAISQAQLDSASPLVKQRAQVIYNAIEPASYRVESEPNGRLLVLGRLCHDKGQDRLIEYANQTGLQLDVAGTVAAMSDTDEIEAEAAKGQASRYRDNPEFQLYLKVRPLIDGEHIRFYGNVGGQLKQNLLGRASALVMPNRWAEPFGMVAIEAMASGTPVVAMASGALPELIVHGVTGYLASSFNELCRYLQPDMLAKLDRAKCRQHVQDNFAASAIAQEYLSLYRQVAGVPVVATIKAPAMISAQQPAFLEQLPKTRRRAE